MSVHSNYRYGDFRKENAYHFKARGSLRLYDMEVDIIFKVNSCAPALLSAIAVSHLE